MADDAGRVLARLGDPSLAVFPRSSAKPVQAVPFVASGASDALGLAARHVALACASHEGEPFHVAAVREMLAAAGADESLLRCGPEAPRRDEDRRRLARAGEEPLPIHNNCSGKHAGMIAACVRSGWDPAGYWRADHPLQQRIRALVAELAGLPGDAVGHAVDGCGVPAWHLPLDRFAVAGARLVAGREPAGEAGDRILAAMAAHPEMVGGTDRFDTELARAANRPVVAKGGAEGFYLLAWRTAGGTGRALAAKGAAGEPRGRICAVAEAAVRLGLVDRDGEERLERFRRGPLRNHAGEDVGRLVPLLELPALADG